MNQITTRYITENGACYEQYVITDPEAKTALTITPERGGMITSFTLDGEEFVWTRRPNFSECNRPRFGVPVLFPSCGNPDNGVHIFDGKAYPMETHGFADLCAWEVESVGPDGVTLALESTPLTKFLYPFDFTLLLNYNLEGNKALVSLTVINEGNTDRAEMLAWDLTNNLVGKPEGEKIWTNGECSIIAAAILCVVCDNQKRPEFQNMTNVYWFISEMCRTIGNKMPLLEYVKKLSPSHPARALLSISDVAPSRTRGSFYTSALTTLRLFTSKSIYAITHTSDFTLTDMGSKKQALFVILPDEKTTFYPIASLIVSQQYELLAEAADRRGGRLERRVNFILDEYGNFTPISDMTNKLTVAAGRGMRYALFVQGFDQLKEKYSDNIANTIKGNCQVWAYLQSDDPETLREMSDKLGSYTTSSYQLSASNGKYTTPSNSQSVSLTERKLLNTDEVRRVKRPHQIITSRDHPAMRYAPDLSQWMFNKLLGLGDMEHNRRLREEREQKRPIITDTKQEIALWNIWIYYQKDIMRRLSQQKGAMGGGLDDD